MNQCSTELLLIFFENISRNKQLFEFEQNKKKQQQFQEIISKCRDTIDPFDIELVSIVMNKISVRDLLYFDRIMFDKYKFSLKSIDYSMLERVKYRVSSDIHRWLLH